MKLCKIYNEGVKMKIGLVLEGGGMRTLFTAGVLDAFLDKDIKVDGVVGVSAGALFGVNYISGQKERSVRYNKKYSNEKGYMGFYSWITTGNAVNKDFAFYKIPFKLDKFDEKEFEKAKVDFYVVMTNIETGKPEYVLIKDVFKQMEYFRATSALPFASKIIEIKGKADVALKYSICLKTSFIKTYSGFPVSIFVITT